MSGHLLLDERPMMVLPSLAKELKNVNKAIAIQHVHWVVTIKEEHDDDRTFLDGYMWCKLTHQQWLTKICWMGDRGLRKMLKQLEESGFLICCKPKSASGDHTKWYRIDYEKLGNSARNKVPHPEPEQSATPARNKVPNLEPEQSAESSIDKKIFKDPFKERGEEPQGKVLDLLVAQANTGKFSFGEKDPKTQTPSPEKQKKENQPAAPRESVPVTAKPIDPYAARANARKLPSASQKAKELIEELCPWSDFFEARKKVLASTEYYRTRTINIVEGTVLKRYTKKLEDAHPRNRFNTMADYEQAIAEVKELIKTDVGELGLGSISGTQQPWQSRREDLYEEIHQKYQNDPSEARILAGRHWNKYKIWSRKYA